MSRQQSLGDLIKKSPAAQAFLHLRERYLAQSNMILQITFRIKALLLWIILPRKILHRTTLLKGLPRIAAFPIAKPCQGQTSLTR
jgi:hypothetical protein